jgi:hypothetical protein
MNIGKSEIYMLFKKKQTPEEVSYSQEVKVVKKKLSKAKRALNWNSELWKLEAKVKELSKLDSVGSYSSWVEDDFVLYPDKIKAKKTTALISEDLIATVSPAGRFLVLTIATKDWSVSGDMDIAEAAKIHDFAFAVNRQVERLKEGQDLLLELNQAQQRETAFREALQQSIQEAEEELALLEEKKP